MTLARLKTGRQGEDVAVQFLLKKGYRIVERNFRCPFGEMDIVARQADTLVFVEVRSRRTEGFGGPLDSIGALKQKKLSRIALCYIQKHHLEGQKARFDVLGVRLRDNGHEIEMIMNAFDVIC